MNTEELELFNRFHTTYNRDLVTAQFDRVVAGTSLMIPRELIKLLLQMGGKREGRDTVALVYHLIESALERSEDDENGIHHKNFEGISTSYNSIKKAKNFLEEHGFLDLGDSYQVGKSSKKHSLFNKTEKGEYKLEKKNANDALYAPSPKAPLKEERCIQTRRNLDQLEVDIECARSLYDHMLFKYLMFPREKTLTKGEKKKILNGEKIEDLPERRPDDLVGLVTPLRNLIYKRGKIHRSDKGGRLFSPLTQLKSEFRQCLTVDGESLVCVDMTACQPSLIAMLAKDEKLFLDCQNEIFYENIANELNVDRAAAKQCFCIYSFGQNRKDTDKNRRGLQVQDLMKKEYPKTHQYVWEQKEQKLYNNFSHQVQWLESEIFIDKIMAELDELGIFALSIHDGICGKASDREIIAKIVEKHTEKYFNVKPKYKVESLWNNRVMFNRHMKNIMNTKHTLL